MGTCLDIGLACAGVAIVSIASAVRSWQKLAAIRKTLLKVPISGKFAFVAVVTKVRDRVGLSAAADSTPETKAFRTLSGNVIRAGSAARERCFLAILRTKAK
jgi:hypothetical protein